MTFKTFVTGLLILFLSVFAPVLCPALEKENVIVVANKSVSESISLSTHYIEQRGLSRKQRILVRTVTTEACSRETYEKDIAAPVRTYLIKKKIKPNETCLVLMYGLPLKITENRDKEKTKDSKNRVGNDSKASVDSELSLVLETDYPLSGWITNPICVVNQSKSLFIDENNVVMVARLDGPSPESVRRIINDSIEAEKSGLKGHACFDARWPEKSHNSQSAYNRFDSYIHAAARLTENYDILPTKLDTTPQLFQKGDCPDTALYCGWYSLAKYVDAFEWARGAVGYHVASAECVTLKKENSQVWCKMMIEKGVAATLGPVGEPYLQSFPRPDYFFRYLYEGDALAVAYMKSTPFLSWKMVLIGDPLYRPFQ